VSLVLGRSVRGHERERRTSAEGRARPGAFLHRRRLACARELRMTDPDQSPGGTHESRAEGRLSARSVLHQLTSCCPRVKLIRTTWFSRASSCSAPRCAILSSRERSRSAYRPHALRLSPRLRQGRRSICWLNILRVGGAGASSPTLVTAKRRLGQRAMPESGERKCSGVPCCRQASLIAIAATLR